MLRYENVKFEKKGKLGTIGVISMNREKSRNNLTYEHFCELIYAFKEMDADHEVCIIILRGEGPVWCSGLDTDGDLKVLFEKAAELFELIQTIDTPVIGAIQKLALAVGGGLAGAMDMIIAAEGTKIQCPGAMMGGVCGVPMVPHISSMPKRLLLEFFCSGEAYDVSELKAYGLINKIVPKDKLDEESLAFAEKFGDKSRIAIKYGKKVYLELTGIKERLHSDYKKALELQWETGNTIDFQKGFRAFIEGRKYDWKGW